MEYVTASLSSGSSWTDKIGPPSQGDLEHMGYLTVAVKGTWTGTLTIKADIGGVEFDIDTMTANGVNNLFLPVHSAQVLVGFASSSDYDSGTADVYVFKPGT